jgi:hypothetical protein
VDGELSDELELLEPEEPLELVLFELVALELELA